MIVLRRSSWFLLLAIGAVYTTNLIGEAAGVGSVIQRDPTAELYDAASAFIIALLLYMVDRLRRRF